MRMLFSAVSAYGHLLPMVPPKLAASNAGDQVAVMSSAEMADVIANDPPPSVRFPPAGPMPMELGTVAAKHTGGDSVPPTVDLVVETFGGVHLDLD